MKKKIACSVLAILLLIGVVGSALFFVSRSEDKGSELVDGLFLKTDFQEKGHLSRNREITSDAFSLFYDNQDGTKTMYVFSSPVQFLDEAGQWQLIDNTLVESKTGYLYENKQNDIHTYYPDMQKETSFLLKYEDNDIKMQPLCNNVEIEKQSQKTLFDTQQEMVTYYKEKGVSISYYTTNLGVKCQMVLTRPVSDLDFTFSMESGFALDQSNTKYFTFKDEKNQTAALLYQPVMADKNGNPLQDETARLSLKTGERGAATAQLLVQPNVDKNMYPLTVEFSLNMYKGNQVDSSIQSSIPNENQYLNQYLYVGATQAQGQAESYIRFETDSMAAYVSDQKIESANYIFYGLKKQQSPLELYQCDTHWTSTKLTWNTRQAFDTKLSDITQFGDHAYLADVTNLVQQWSNPVCKDNGFLIRNGGDEAWEMIASADNGYMCPRLEIKLLR